eukprot:246676-Alexandrium_andersonii.AAC.1
MEQHGGLPRRDVLRLGRRRRVGDVLRGPHAAGLGRRRCRQAGGHMGQLPDQGRVAAGRSAGLRHRARGAGCR